MDVILDTNIIFNLLQAHGAEFTKIGRFADLTSYLRRSGSALVIPVVVLEEFSKKYIDFVADSYKKSHDTWESLNRNLVAPAKYPAAVDPKREWEQISTQLLNPAKGVQVKVFNDYSCVPVNEVVRRGIHRIRPASPKGEELRDVAIWLMTLEYARNGAIAFISDDGTYAEDNGLHADLKQDLAERKVQINFYTSIPQFTKGNALDAQELGSRDLDSFVQPAEIQEMIRDYVVGKNLSAGKRIVKAEIGTPRLLEGTKYAIAADSTYIEVAFSAESRVELHENAWTTFLTQPWATERAAPTKIGFTPASTSFIDFGPELLPTSQNLFQQSFVDPKVWQSNFVTVDLPPVKPVISTETVTFKADFALRITAGKRQSLELDKVSA